jgi:hypothetical protein
MLCGLRRIRLRIIGFEIDVQVPGIRNSKHSRISLEGGKIMLKGILRTSVVGAAGLAMSVSSAFAVPNLVITEAYVGVSGDDVTEDWFEITNLGDMAWDLNAQPLYYDDVSAEPLDKELITNISSIAPNESVIVVIGEGLAEVAEFFTAWDNGGMLTGVQIGYSDGAGLGQGGDGITIFDSVDTIVSSQSTGATADARTLIYNPTTMTFGDLAAVGVYGAYEAAGGPGGDAGEYPLIGSPGVVPEPASLLLLSIGGLALIRRRNRA